MENENFHVHETKIDGLPPAVSKEFKDVSAMVQGPAASNKTAAFANQFFGSVGLGQPMAKPAAKPHVHHHFYDDDDGLYVPLHNPKSFVNPHHTVRKLFMPPVHHITRTKQ